jgi:hypothetical protein
MRVRIAFFMAVPYPKGGVSTPQKASGRVAEVRSMVDRNIGAC